MDWREIRPAEQYKSLEVRIAFFFVKGMVRKGNKDVKHVDVVYNKNFEGEMISFEKGWVLAFVFVF